uniref:Uncharacterized protein n=1 Tax=Timema genevievae TaxID=629358 RepID=A0A7R9PR14_TIMGE|nr:unnamed protein product [Timema genevievae]
MATEMVMNKMAGKLRKERMKAMMFVDDKLEEVQLVLKDKDQQLTTLHQQLLELQGANRQLNQEKFDAQAQVDILFGDKEALEAQLKSLLSNRDTQQTSDKVVISQQPQEEQLASCQAELCQQRALYNQIKILQEQTDRALADAQSQLSAVQSELTTLHARVQELERERSLLEREVTGLKAECNTQRSTLAQVDQERDTLLLAVDSKTEQLAVLEQELKAKDTHLTKIKEVVADLQKKLAGQAPNTHTPRGGRSRPATKSRTPLKSLPGKGPLSPPCNMCPPLQGNIVFPCDKGLVCNKRCAVRSGRMSKDLGRGPEESDDLQGMARGYLEH